MAGELGVDDSTVMQDDNDGHNAIRLQENQKRWASMIKPWEMMMTTMEDSDRDTLVEDDEGEDNIWYDAVAVQYY